MGFRLFGVNVEVQFSFWLTTIMMGVLGARSTNDAPRAVAVWVGVVFLSVLVHEYGHAFAIRRQGAEPEISLHGMGGTTSWHPTRPVSRGARIFISLAGPLAGFALASIVWAFRAFAPPGVLMALPAFAHEVLEALLWVNIVWGVVNLLPVLPLDGGHVVEHALGPTRARTTALISLVFACMAVAAFISMRMYIAALIFGMSAVQSYQRYRAADAPLHSIHPPRPRDAELPGEIHAKLVMARSALASEDLDRASALAQSILAGEPGEHPPPRAAHQALHILAWVELLRDRPDRAAELVARASRIEPADAALAGAVLMAQGDAKQARKVLEAARAAGDQRKEVAGPLIQLLLAEGETARAAALALDIVEALSAEDIRKMASIAFDAGAYEWSARLYEALFRREGAGEDAYEAARSLAIDGEAERALDLLRKAVAAGFSDHGRAWSDAALEGLRASNRLEAVLPRV